MTRAIAPSINGARSVSAVEDLYNDGSYPDAPADALLVEAGEKGEIVNIGTHVGNKHAYLSRRIQGEDRGGLLRRRDRSL